ncbi:MAG: PAS domain S-box protein [Verrucomicrobiota bacterium]|nr:PAS domain S-box protein [Verrucomicrobiota bacterium]
MSQFEHIKENFLGRPKTFAVILFLVLTSVSLNLILAKLSSAVLLTVASIGCLLISFSFYLILKQVQKAREQETEKTELLRKVQRSERELYSFIDAANVILLVSDEKGNVAFCNNYLERVVGFTEPEIKSTSWWRLFRVQFQQVEELEKLFSAHNAAERFETSILTAKLETRHILWNISPSILNGEYRYVCVGRDITERKTNSEALKLSEEKYQQLFEVMHEGVIVADTKGKIIQCNAAAQKILELSSSEILSRTIVDPKWKLFREDMTEFPLSDHPSARALREHRTREGTVIGILKPSGAITWTFTTAAAITYGDQCIGVVTTFADISRVKGAEQALQRQRERLNLILQNVESAIVLFDTEDRVVAFNPQLCKLWTLNPDWLRTRPTLLEFASKMGQASPNPSEILQKIGVAHRQLEPSSIDLVFHDKFQVEAYTVRLPDSHRLWTFRNISDRKVVERQLQQAQKMESVGALAGGLAHDFNNILTVIQGYISLMIEQTPIGDKKHKALKRIEEACSRAAILTRKLLTFSRGGFFKKTSTSLNKLMRDSEELLSRSIPENIQIQLVLDPSDKNIYVDSGAMEQVLINLCLNARDAMPDGGSLILQTEYVLQPPERILAKIPQADTQGCLRWTVQDTGSGMPPEILARVFEPFFTTKHNKSGSGLGMSMVYGIIQSHGGLVEIVSEVGKGTSMIMYIPISDIEATDDGEPLRLSHSRYFLEGSTVLLVDDEILVLEMVQALLEDEGVAVTVARSGDEALRIFRECNGMFSGVISDMVMPGMSGAELFEKLKEIKTDVKMIISSGYTQSVNLDDLRKKGVSGILMKPYDASSLFKLLQEVISGN